MLLNLYIIFFFICFIVKNIEKVSIYHLTMRCIGVHFYITDINYLIKKYYYSYSFMQSIIINAISYLHLNFIKLTDYYIII